MNDKIRGSRGGIIGINPMCGNDPVYDAEPAGYLDSLGVAGIYLFTLVFISQDINDYQVS
ncbi:hypothetical protein GL2_11500 [Microbulbifer sp. GL-2]|nr:hypothetical protein GL2_11500 [Microbulbifer sp. GL-2]